MYVRLTAISDIPALMDLEHQCPTAAHWTEQQYRQVFRTHERPPAAPSQRLALVMEEEAVTEPEKKNVLLGFLVAHHLPPEWELENIVVAPTARRTGLATRLLQEFLARARETETKSESVFLEVRESNQAARAFYSKQGFEKTGVRKAYYTSPIEDAILYRRSLP